MNPRKRFGQHFLRDPMILQTFYKVIAPKSQDHLVEIGPGQGALTDYLVGQSQQLDLVEIDRDLVPLLTERYQEQVTVHQADVLDFDFSQLAQGKKLRIVGNLPYNISTPLLFHLFDQIDCVQDMHFLLQKEVVDRLCAEVNTKAYGRLGIMTSIYCNTQRLMNVPAEAFDPPPKVTSAFIRLVPRADRPSTTTIEKLQWIVREAFNHRRKTISNALKAILTPEELMTIGIEPKKRPQELDLEDYIRISDAIKVK